MKITRMAVALAAVLAMAGCGSGSPGSVVSASTPAATSSTSMVESTPDEPAAAEVIAEIEAEVRKVEDKRSECVAPNASGACDVEQVRMAMDVGRESVQKLSRLTVPGVDRVIAAAGDLAAPQDGVACVETGKITSCFFAGPAAYRAAQALEDELAVLKENL